jgi:hypothetical protein
MACDALLCLWAVSRAWTRVGRHALSLTRRSVSASARGGGVQELGEAVHFFLPMKRLFFQNETLWSVVLDKLKIAVQLAAFRGSEPPKPVSPPTPRFRVSLFTR